MMCKYCARTAGNTMLLNAKGLILTVRNSTNSCLCASWEDNFGYPSAMVEINYCPVCGGKLRENIIYEPKEIRV